MTVDLILHEAPPDPQALGLSDKSRLELYTEFVPETPQPVQTARVLSRESDPALRQAMVEPDFTDHLLDFGSYKMGSGVAFELPGPKPETKIPVAKLFANLGGRPVLVEAIEWQAAKRMLAALPRAKGALDLLAPPKALLAAARPPAGANQGIRDLPVRRLAEGPFKPIQEARADLPTPEERAGFLVDYSLVTGASNFRFFANTNYYVASDANFYGHTVFENCVIKYKNSSTLAAIRVRGTVEFRTGEYTPLICTSENDDSVGEILPWSTGNPWVNSYGGPMLEFDFYSSGQPAAIKHVRLSHANSGISFFGGAGHELKHAQFVRCTFPLMVYYADVRARNILVYQADKVVNGSVTAIARFEHLTAHQANFLNANTDPDPESNGAVVYLTNSLFVAVTNTGVYYGANNASNTSSSAFLEVGAAAHYLAGSAYRGKGTMNINSSLLAEIRQRTTQPPVIQTNGWIVVDMTLHPRPEIRYGAGAVPDLGFHYPVLDHIFGAAVLNTNCTLTVNPGAALGFAPQPQPGLAYGLLLMSGARLIVDGSPTNLARLVHHHFVQEQSTNVWTTRGTQFYLPWWDATPQAELRWRFAQVSVGFEAILQGYGGSTPVSLMDCQVHGGYLWGFPVSVIGFTNCLLDRVLTAVDAGYTPNVTFRNNLFRGGYFEIFDFSPNVTMRDNFFDRTTIPYWNDVTSSHNGYVSGADRLLPAQASDKLLTAPVYQTGPLGD